MTGSASSWTINEQELKNEEYDDGPKCPHSGPAGISLHVGREGGKNRDGEA